MPAKPAAATCRATSSAACGGQIDKITGQRATMAGRSAPDSSAASARPVLARLRPVGSHSTVCPAETRQPPTAAPISPGCSSPTLAMRVPLLPVGTNQPDLPVGTNQPDLPVGTNQPDLPVGTNQPDLPVGRASRQPGGGIPSTIVPVPIRARPVTGRSSPPGTRRAG